LNQDANPLIEIREQRRVNVCLALKADVLRRSLHVG